MGAGNRAGHWPGSSQADLLVALRSLERRSLIGKKETGFTLQNVLMEFSTDYLVSSMALEISQGQPDFFTQFPLLNAQARSFIRLTQERLLLQPTARLLTSQGGTSQAIHLIKNLLARLSPSDREYSYAGGNILNLLLYLGVKDALDFSGMAVWHAHLRGKTVPPLNFNGADLTGAARTEPGSLAPVRTG